MLKLSWRKVGGALFCAIGLFAFATFVSIEPLPQKLIPEVKDLDRLRIVDRFGVPISVRFGGKLNITDYVPLGTIDSFLKQAFILAEDKRFYQHAGVDWQARLHAVWQNLKALRIVRGASTISEQVVRILHPRPRTLWSRWIEGFEAKNLEKSFTKDEILEFYLNEVPYGSERRGIVQAARLYFGRDISTLNNSEMLALASIVRAPTSLDPGSAKANLLKTSTRLLNTVRENGVSINEEKLNLELAQINKKQEIVNFDNYQFVQYVKKISKELPTEFLVNNRLVTTLDSSLQRFCSKILNERLRTLKKRNVRNGAILVVDHEKNEVLAWVNANSDEKSEPDSYIDAVLTPRQPGSALKPFLYSLALEKGWTAATLIEDQPIAQAVGLGIHSYRNYSRLYYGSVRLRDALANSLNIPAVRTVGYVGVPQFYTLLRKLGFESLDKTPEFYGEGLALGNGEVSLFELVRAYATLARGGVSAEISVVKDGARQSMEPKRIFSEESATIIGNILSDRLARRLEFGSSGILSLPQQTAIKTGTSSDFKDIWAVGYSGPYTVGIWMGNLDREPTRELTGASGPALVLRGIFHELNKREFSSNLGTKALIGKRICSISGKLAGKHCPVMDEWFNPKVVPLDTCSENHKDELANVETDRPSIMVPTAGLQIAMDPRIPDEKEALALQLRDKQGLLSTRWFVDNELFAETKKTSLPWKLQKGQHSVWAEALYKNSGEFVETEPINFVVK